MGINQSVPRITAQDRAILEYVLLHPITTLSISNCSPPPASNYSVTNFGSIRGRCAKSSGACGSLPSFCSQIQVVLDREQEIAKTHLATGQKDRALIALRQRKYQQSLLLKTDTQLENLEQLVHIPLHDFAVLK